MDHLHRVEKKIRSFARLIFDSSITYFYSYFFIGDIMYTNIFGQDIIIVNSVEIATELVDKRSNIYSDRPDIPSIGL